MWNPEHRLAAERHGLRYPSDLTDPRMGIVGADDSTQTWRPTAGRECA